MAEICRVYCAGPLFNEAERREMLEISDILRAAGYETFVPHADGMEFAQVQPYLAAEGYDAAQAGQLLHTAIFALDVYQVVEACDALVFNMNGRVPDEGAVAEATMAWMLGKPVVIFKEDARSKIAGRDNPLLVGQSRFVTVAVMVDIPAALDVRTTECGVERLTPSTTAHYPSHLQETVAQGRQLWQRLTMLGKERHAAHVADAVMEIFGPLKLLRA